MMAGIIVTAVNIAIIAVTALGIRWYEGGHHEGR